MRERRRAAAAGAVAALVLVAACGRPAAAGTSPGQYLARRAAAYFLDHYERPDGRVVRTDQGGDTVSEGQAYAMLLALALNDRGRFDAAWQWARQHLQEPTGLLAWHWNAGRVVGPAPATDADVGAAAALALGWRRFATASYLYQAQRMAAAVLSLETATVGSRRILVAGPWARGPVPVVDPSYDSPVELAALADADPSGGWSQVAGDTGTALSQLVGGGLLPPDWAQVGPRGTARPAPPPGNPGGAVTYGFDAVRVPVWLASSCRPGDRRLAAGMWPVLAARARSGRALVGLDLGGGTTPASSRSAVGLVGAAGAADAAGHAAEAARLLGRAWRANLRAPTYYASAWVALGAVLLETHLLGTCGRGPGPPVVSRPPSSR